MFQFISTTHSTQQFHFPIDMFYTKLYLLFGIILTIVSAHLDSKSKLPYFPIEISRVAASSTKTLNLFRTTAVLVGPVMLLFGELEDTASLVVWAGLVLLAWFDDASHIVLHMCGVAILGVGSLMSDKLNISTVAAAVIIYGARLVIKAGVLIGTGVVPINRGLVVNLTSKGLDIMFNGQTNLTNKQWVLIALMYKTAGVMQWIVFVLLSTLF